MTTHTTDERGIETLPGGMRVIMRPSSVNSIVSIALFMPLPGAIVAPAEAGLVRFLHKMLLRGTTTRSAAELNEAIEALGTSISSSDTDDYSQASMVCTSDTLAESVELLADVVLNPSFEPEEIEKERQVTLAAIRRDDDDRFSLTLRRFARELYGGHGYGLPARGLPETVREFRRDQLVELHQAAVDPSTMLAVCVGDFDPDAARELLMAHFPPRGTAGEPFHVVPPAPVPPARVRFSRDSEQAFLAMGFRACAAGADDAPAVRVLNGVLGEGMSSRFFTRLRDEQGLAYATGCALTTHLHAGHMVGYIGTKPATLDTAREGMAELFAAIRREPVTAEELERTRNYIIGKFLIDHQTNLRRAFYLGHYETMGLGMERDERLPVLIGAVTAEQVLEAANRYLHEPTVVELLPE